VQARGLLDRGHLILQDRPVHVTVDLSFPGRAAPGRAAPVRDQHREALLSEPLGHQEPPVQLRGDPLPARPAVRVGQDRKPALAGPVPGRQVQHRPQLPRPEHEPGRVHVEHRPFAQRGDGNGRPAVPRHHGPPAGPVRAPGHVHQGPGPAHAVVDRGFGGQLLDAVARPVRPQVGLGRLGRRGEQHLVAVHAEHRLHLKAGRRDRVAVHGQIPGPVQVGMRHHRAGGGAGGGARNQQHPARVALLAQDGRLAAGRVDAEEPHRELVTRLHHRVGAVGVPAGAWHVLEGLPVPAGLRPRTVQSRDPQRDVGVGGAGRRITHHPRRTARLGRIGEVPALDARGIHPRDQQPGPVRSPPEPPQAAEPGVAGVLSDPERDVGLVSGGDHPVPGPVRLDHPQRAVADVGDAPAGRVRARVGDRALRLQAPGRAVGHVHRPQPVGQGEGRQPDGLVGGVGADPGARLRRLGRSGRLSGQQLGGIGEQPLGPGVQVQRPQAPRRVVARPGAQEQHLCSVGPDGELTGNAQGEAPRPGDLGGQRHRCHVRETLTSRR
jgi:hypothetical protein